MFVLFDNVDFEIYRLLQRTVACLETPRFNAYNERQNSPQTLKGQIKSAVYITGLFDQPIL